MSVFKRRPERNVMVQETIRAAETKAKAEFILDNMQTSLAELRDLILGDEKENGGSGPAGPT